MTEFRDAVQGAGKSVNTDWDAYDARNKVDAAIEVEKRRGHEVSSNLATGQSVHEMLRSAAGQLEVRARGMRELADILQASELVRRDATSPRVWALIQSMINRPV